MFPEVDVEDIRNNAVSGSNSGGSFSTTTVPNVYTQTAPSVGSCASFGGCEGIVQNLNDLLNNCNLNLENCTTQYIELAENIVFLLNDFCVNREDKERGLVDGEIYLMSHSGRGNRTAYSPSKCPGPNCPPIPVWVTFTFYKVSTGANVPGYFRIEAGYVNGGGDRLVISTADNVASIIHTLAYIGTPSYYCAYNPALAGTTVYAGFNVNGFAEYVSLGSFRYPDVVNDIPIDLCAE
jgi:hypothetical protein